MSEAAPVSDPDLVAAFRPRARLLQLLGDQLIGSPRLAIFELVKNGYDADATRVEVMMRRLTSERASIEVRDNGVGMSLETLRDVWLVPGHDHRARQRERGERTGRGRLPLGEKGVGRFAVHKLGNVVEVVTRQPQGQEIELRIDWDDLTSAEYLADASVTARVREPRTFEGDDHGTLVTIRSLRGKDWTRGEVRRLARQITSISSPFATGTDDFRAVLTCPTQKGWLSDLPDTADLIRLAPWEFSFEITDNRFTWMYRFRRVPGVRLPARQSEGDSDGVLLDRNDLPEADRERLETKVKSPSSTADLQDGIGTVTGRFFVYDRDPDVLNRLGFTQSLQSFLDESGGLRVYRDGIRVYNYGEPGDDWLGLDLRRVNSPSKRISNNIIVGAIELDLTQSTGLREKTNREGFVENDALLRLRALIRGVLSAFEAERNIDKQAIRKLLANEKTSAGGSIERPLASIRRVAKKAGMESELQPLLAQAQRSYDEMRAIMLRAGISNMSLVLVYHEIEHGMKLLERHLRGTDAAPIVVEQARNLVSVIDGFGDLLRKNKAETHDLRVVLGRAIDLNSVRLNNHDISLVQGIDWARDARATEAQFPLSLVLGALTNLLDNSIYWMSARWPAPHGEGRRAVFMGIDAGSFDEGIAVIVADNGPGFVDQLSDVTEPFFTRRPDGMGVGLYYVNLIMQTLGGEVRILTPGEARVPTSFDGAVVALIFPRS